MSGSRKSLAPISVVIPTYNRGELLKRALTSVCRQTMPVEEILVVDDGSLDNTERVVKDFKSNLFGSGARIIYLKQDNRGVSSARNVGICEAKRDYIAFLDSDDEWKQDKIRQQILLLEKNKWKNRLVHTDELWIKSGKLHNQKKKHFKTGGYIFPRCLKLCCMSPSSVLLERSLFDIHGFFDEKLPVCEDYDMWIRISAFEDVLFVSLPLTVKYGGHNGQLSKAYWGMDRFRVFALEKLLICNGLKAIQYNQAFIELLWKLRVLYNGAAKRRNSVLLEECARKISFWKIQKEKDNG